MGSRSSCEVKCHHCVHLSLYPGTGVRSRGAGGGGGGGGGGIALPCLWK